HDLPRTTCTDTMETGVRDKAQSSSLLPKPLTWCVRELSTVESEEALKEGFCGRCGQYGDTSRKTFPATTR
ncbi:unnamed protein product, partial [Ectocarpus sp. 4 AP-2014]